MKFDVFLSHNGKDKPVVEQLAHKLEAKGLKVWLDKWNLIPGNPWQEEIEEALDECQTFAVFLGPSGFGPWENEEMRSAISDRVRDRNRRVIPVLLPGAPDSKTLKLPRFLSRATWVDFRVGLEDEEALYRLECGIKGISPGKSTQPESSNFSLSDEIPVPGDLPLGSHLPFSPNALFTGRENELKKLADSILGDSKTSTVITQAVTGMGGLGKTQLAIEFGYRYGKYFRGVHWLNLADPSQLDSEIANCGHGMFTNDFPEDQPSQVALTLQTWKTNGPNLLILDNFEEPSKANDVLTKLRHSNIRILVTSRRTDWSQSLGLSQLKLDLFSPEESLKFLKDSLKNRKDSEDDLKNLAERLGHLPLGLELASRYLNGHGRLSVSEYLKQTENALDHASMKNWRADMPAATKHDLDLQRTFALSWKELSKKGGRVGRGDSRDRIETTAQKIFMSAGYLAPNEPIPLEIFEKALEISSESCDESLAILYGLGLLRETEAQFSNSESQISLPAIHPLLCEYAREVAKENKDILEKLTNTLASLANEANETGLPSQFISIRPHVPVLAAFAEGANVQDAGTLWNSYGYHLNMVADYHGARTAYERALKIDEATFGADHPNVAIRVNNLGMVMKDQGDLDGARAMLERALKIDEAKFGADHPNVARDVNNLGMVMKDQGDLVGARAMFERALKIDEAEFGADHPNVAIRVNNLGSVMKAQGDLDGARAMYERAIKIWEANLGTEHPQVATGVNNLGMAMKAQGDLVGARTMYERALTIFKKFLPADHPNIKVVQKNLDSLDKS